MDSILLTKNDLTSGVDIPADVRSVLSFIAGWDYDPELALWYDDTCVLICQMKYGMWSLYEATTFKSLLIAAGVVVDYSEFVFSSEELYCPSCEYSQHVVALNIRRAYIK